MSIGLKEFYKENGISEEVFDYCQKISEELKDRFEQLDEVAEYNQLKVIGAMQKNQVSDYHFNSGTGYGYNDVRRGNFWQRLLH